MLSHAISHVYLVALWRSCILRRYADLSIQSRSRLSLYCDGQATLLYALVLTLLLYQIASHSLDLSLLLHYHEPTSLCHAVALFRPDHRVVIDFWVPYLLHACFCSDCQHLHRPSIASSISLISRIRRGCTMASPRGRVCLLLGPKK